MLSALRNAESLSDVALLLRVKPSTLSYVLYKLPPTNRYVRFSIPKRGGGVREISAPTPPLRLIQRRLASVLHDCLDEISPAQSLEHSVSHGFRRRHSIATNASRHRNKRYVFNVDLRNFFGSINFGRVRGFFISNRHFMLKVKVATVIAQIACFDNSLPQGSPCSPVISNLLGHSLDMKLAYLASRERCTYTRYADDISFSTNKRVFPTCIAFRNPLQPHESQAGAELDALIRAHGFEVNERKTRLQYEGSRKEVTGLVINGRVNTFVTYRKRVRSLVHRLYTTRQFDLPILVKDDQGAYREKLVEGRPSQLRGMLSFIESIDSFHRQFQGEGIEDKESGKRSARVRTYRDFLLYTQFFANSTPLVVGEGSTDYVHLLHAIRQRAKLFPLLATTDGEGKVQLNTRIYRYGGRSSDRILGLTGGSAVLGKFMRLYDAERKKFSASNMKGPLVVLSDNDSGAAPIIGNIKAISDRDVDTSADFTHVAGNLYVVFTPGGPGGTNSQIEDFYDAPTLSTRVGEKRFDKSNNTDTAKSYGKTVFAHKVVKPNALTLDFSGFDPLLHRIQAAIRDFASRVGALGSSAAAL